MAKELPYFKFFVSEWILGRISDHSDKVQGAFIIAICHYWNKECKYNRIDFERKIGKKRFKMLLDLKFFEVENEMIYIDFLNEQHAELSDIHKVRVKGGLARAEQVRQQKASYIDKDKIIEDKDKDKKLNIEFDVFWNIYNKKVGSKEKLKGKWEKLKDAERQKIIDTLPNFLNGIKDKQYQPHPETYFNNKRWEDEFTSQVKKLYTLYSPLGRDEFMLTEAELIEKKRTGYFKEQHEI